jgi:hypothetical protein
MTILFCFTELGGFINGKEKIIVTVGTWAVMANTQPPTPSRSSWRRVYQDECVSSESAWPTRRKWCLIYMAFSFTRSSSMPLLLINLGPNNFNLNNSASSTSIFARNAMFYETPPVSSGSSRLSFFNLPRLEKKFHAPCQMLCKMIRFPNAQVKLLLHNAIVGALSYILTLPAWWLLVYQR